ncbi:hypothetical protein LJC58_03820 [Lachnospiraceae bacterium OttesenSCG-928-D06]|nr:hypothetical protein [Lachnospiraceae bacterium OttesenSCG-928-D06]
MPNTTAQEIYDCFESTFSDKIEIPDSLEHQWLIMSISKYNTEIATTADTELIYDKVLGIFDKKINSSIIVLLGSYMRVLYQEREYSRVNKIASIVGKDLSVNSGMSLSKYSEKELVYHVNKTNDMTEKQKPSAMV